MIKNIRGLKWCIVFFWMIGFCNGMNDDNDLEFQKTLEESFKNFNSLENKLHNISNLYDQDKNTQALDAFLNLVKDEYVKTKKINIGLKNFWVNKFGYSFPVSNKDLDSFISFIIFTQRILCPDIPSYQDAEQYPYLKGIPHDQELLIQADKDYQKCALNYFKSTDMITQLPCLIQSYPFNYYSSENQEYPEGNLCGWYSVFFVRELLDSKLDLSNTKMVLARVNDRKKFDQFLLKEKHEKVLLKGDLLDQDINRLLFFHSANKMQSFLLSQSIYFGNPEEESFIYLYQFTDKNEFKARQSYIKKNGVLYPLFETFLKTDRAGMVFWCPIKSGSEPEEGSVQHWIGSVFYRTETDDIKMIVVDSLGEQRVNNDRYTMEAYDWFKNTWNEWLTLNNIKLENKPKRIEQEDSLSILSKLLQALKEKLVNLLAQIQKLTTLSN